MLKIQFIVKCISPKIKVIQNDNSETGYVFSEKTLILGKDFFQLNLINGFLRHLKYQHKCNYTDNFKPQLWVLLHELGHCNTQTHIEEDELTERIIYSMIKPSVLMANPQLEDKYYNLKTEWEATEWAIHWINNHKFLAKIFNFII